MDIQKAFGNIDSFNRWKIVLMVDKQDMTMQLRMAASVIFFPP